MYNILTSHREIREIKAGSWTPLWINPSLGRVNRGHNNHCSCGTSPDRASQEPVGTELVICEETLPEEVAAGPSVPLAPAGFVGGEPETQGCP